MTNPVAVNAYAVAVGTAPNVSMVPFVTNVAPATTNIKGPNGPFHIGQVWVNTVTGSSYVLVGLTASAGTITATWATSAGGTTEVSTLSGDTGTAAPVVGNIKIAGTANQITTAGSGSTVTLSVPTAFVAPGSVTATLGNITATNGNLVLSTAGNKLVIPAAVAATSSAGTFTLSGAATTVVTNSTVTASSLIFLQTNALGTVTVASTLAVTAKSAGISFTVTPSQSTDTSNVSFLIIN